MDMLKHACWLHLQNVILRYLESNAEGRWNEAEKAQRHMELCTFYVAVVRGVGLERVHSDFHDDYRTVLKKTQELTDYLDEAIGFPLSGRPDYDRLGRLFHEKFHVLALEALLVEDGPNSGQKY